MSEISEELKKKIIKTQIYGIPAAVCLGLGLYGLFGADGDAVLPFLNDRNMAVSLVVIGVVLEAWQLYLILPLLKKQAELNKKESK